MAKKLDQLDREFPQVMAVLNVTPDSFSDGGSYFSGGRLNLDKVRTRVQQAINEGASIVDVGGESTRPGAKSVFLQEEMDRVLPVVEVLREFDVAVSVDTSSPQVMLESAKHNIALINDVRALQREGALEAASRTGLPVCLMHMQGTPQSMQDNPDYSDLLAEVTDFFIQRIACCNEMGIANEDLILDPGFGFGKTLAHNALLLSELEALKEFDLPLLVGLSRKSMITHLLGERCVDERLPASLALAVMAAERGAWIVRVHDVKASADALKTLASIKRLAAQLK